MPNWCNNDVTIFGNPDKIKLINEKLESIKNNEDKVHGIFRVLLGTDITEEEYKTGWYNHNINRYGCKWDVSYDADLCISITEDTITMTFQTAWSPCVPFCTTLSEMYGVKVTCTYSEPGVDFAGKTVSKNGEIIEQEQYPYKEGLYHLDNEGFWENLEYDIQYELEENPDKTVDELFSEYEFLEEDDKPNFIEIFNEVKSNL